MNDRIKDFLINHPSFTTDEFADVLYEETPGIGRATIFNVLKQKCSSGEISRIGRGHFVSSAEKAYTYDLSEHAKEISSLIQLEYPLIKYQVWELYQLNEFVNHQFSKNTIFIDVENMLDESVFNLLFERYPHVLHNPDIKEYEKYAGDETVVVRKLISEAPMPTGQHHQAALEKILVDLFARGIPRAIVSRSEYPKIFEEAFRKYNINQTKMLRYARRRGVSNSLADFIHSNTDITLEIK